MYSSKTNLVAGVACDVILKNSIVKGCCLSQQLLIAVDHFRITAVTVKLQD